MWSGIINRQFLLFDLPERLNGESYLNFLENDLDVNYLVECGSKMMLHRATTTGLFELISRNSSVADGLAAEDQSNGPHTPRIWTPLIFLCGGYFAEIVYAQEYNSEQELRNRLRQVQVQMENKPEPFRKSRNIFLKQCWACIQANGGHFEHLLYVLSERINIFFLEINVIYFSS